MRGLRSPGMIPRFAGPVTNSIATKFLPVCRRSNSRLSAIEYPQVKAGAIPAIAMRRLAPRSCGKPMMARASAGVAGSMTPEFADYAQDTRSTSSTFFASRPRRAIEIVLQLQRHMPAEQKRLHRGIELCDADGADIEDRSFRHDLDDLLAALSACKALRPVSGSIPPIAARGPRRPP